MKKIKKFFTVLTLTLAATMLMPLVSCGPDKPGKDNDSSDVDSVVTYKVTIKGQDGKGIMGAMVEFFDESGKSLGFDATDSSGTYYIKLEKGNYTFEVSNLPDGYSLSETTFHTGTETQFFLKAGNTILEGPAPDGTRYTLDSAMYDFEYVNLNEFVVNTEPFSRSQSYYTLEGEGIFATYKKASITRFENGVTYYIHPTSSLQEQLETHDLVLLNFWYIDCYWCQQEFPAMQRAYEQYKDKVAFIALNVSDFGDEITNHMANTGLTFPACEDVEGLANMFAIQGAPTSAFIDRYGLVSYIHQGAIQSESEFAELFDLFIGENYEHKSGENLIDLGDVPDVEMPSSESIEALINGKNYNYSYYPEKGEAAAATWPWVIDEEKGAIKTSNALHSGSFCSIYSDIHLEAGDTLAISYNIDTEEGYDILYIGIDNNIIQQLSGNSKGWKDCFIYVAEEAGDHTFTMIYAKDSSGNGGLDTCWVKDVRIVPESEITEPTYVIRDCARGPIVDEKTQEITGYETYVEVFYNEKDKYYHVKSEDGPLLLASLLNRQTNWSPYTFYDYAVSGYFDVPTNNPTQIIKDYAAYAANSADPGYVPVTKELAAAIKRAMQIVAENPKDNNVPKRQTYENEWLEICYYFSAYGTGGKQKPDPIAGLAPFTAYEGHVGLNTVVYDRLLNPQGFYVAITPEESGVYKFYGISGQETNGRLYDENNRELNSNDEELREQFLPTMVNFGDEKIRIEAGFEYPGNFVYYHYLQKGVTYYAKCYFYDIEALGVLNFRVDRVGDSFDAAKAASDPTFTTKDLDWEKIPEGEIIEDAIILKHVDIRFCEDGYYHHLNKNGTVGSIIYAEFLINTNAFPDDNIKSLIDKGAFYYGEQLVDKSGKNVLYSQKEKAVNYNPNLDDTPKILPYLDKMESSEVYNGQIQGCVAVDERLAEILQKLMDKYTFAGVSQSWLMMCYYMEHYGI